MTFHTNKQALFYMLYYGLKSKQRVWINFITSVHIIMAQLCFMTFMTPDGINCLGRLSNIGRLSSWLQGSTPPSPHPMTGYPFRKALMRTPPSSILICIPSVRPLWFWEVLSDQILKWFRFSLRDVWATFIFCDSAFFCNLASLWKQEIPWLLHYLNI